MSFHGSDSRADFLASSNGLVVENDILVDWPAISTMEMQRAEYWPLSGEPFFHIIMSKSYAGPPYKMMLPKNFALKLPSGVILTVLTYRGNSWKIVYNGKSTCKRFDSGWKTFVHETCLKVGDACVFGLAKHSKEQLIFRVQILRGHLPSKFIGKADGESADSPIIID